MIEFIAVNTNNEYNEIERYDDEIEDWVAKEILIAKRIEVDIVLDDVVIGGMTVFENFVNPDESDPDWVETVAYLATIDIDSAYQRKGYGTEAIKNLADKYGKIYLCPTNEDNERLYARLGEECDAPECLQNIADEYKLYVVE